MTTPQFINAVDGTRSHPAVTGRRIFVLILAFGVMLTCTILIPRRDSVVHSVSSATQLSDADVADMDPGVQARLLQPLRQLAQLLDTQARSTRATTYSGVELMATTGTVDLFVTDLAAGAALVAHGRQVAPSAAWSKVRLRKSAFSRVVLTRAVARLLAGTLTAQLENVAVPADGDGLEVRLDSGAVRADVASAGLGIPVYVQIDPAISVKSWADVKWHDSPPYIGGDLLTATGRGFCTAGLPAVRRSDIKAVMVTASHCFATGTRVYTGGGTTGAIGNGRLGNYVGTVGARNLEWDAEEITGTNNNADESDTAGWKPLTSVAYSYTGDYVCQDGAASFFLGHPTPCGIRVTDDDIWFSIGGHMSRGVEGIDIRNGWGSHNGDSGGTIFAVEARNARQARGIVSSGGLDGTVDQRRIDWTEALDILHAFNLRLNPQT